MDSLSFRTQLQADVDVLIHDWAKVKEQCEGNTLTIEEFSERLSHDFWKAVPIDTVEGIIRRTEIGYFIQDNSGLEHHLIDEGVYGNIVLTISNDLHASSVEKIL